MTDSYPRDVWVKSRARHTPAHRITEPVADDAEPAPMYAVACPPYLLTGGVAVTRKEAAALPAFPCMECFPPPGRTR